MVCEGMGVASDKSDYSTSQFLLAIAAALTAGGIGMSWLPYVWGAAAGALLFQFLVNSAFVGQHFPYLGRTRVACVVSVVLFGAWALENYLTPAISLYLVNREPYVITDGNTKWVKIEATRNASGPAKCWGYIDDLRRDGDADYIMHSGEHRKLSADDSGDRGLGNGFHMGGGASRMFNIATSKAADKVMHIDSEAFNNLIQTPLGPGTYHAKIEVSGEDCGPAYADVTIHYEGGLNISVLPIRTGWKFPWQ
jgi:hypothetical protein